MPELPILHDLLRRALKGEEAALGELVRLMEPIILRAVRVHLPSYHPLRRLLDSQDICQSVLRDFFVKAGAEAFAYLDPKCLPELLRVMARQKFIDHLRQFEGPHRDHRRNRGGEAVQALADPECLAEVVADRDLYAEIRRRLLSRECAFADRWTAGYSFAEIAAQGKDEAGGPLKPSAVRMALERAFLRVARALPQGHGIQVDARLLKATYYKVANQLTCAEGSGDDATDG